MIEEAEFGIAVIAFGAADGTADESESFSGYAFYGQLKLRSVTEILICETFLGIRRKGGFSLKAKFATKRY